MSNVVVNTTPTNDTVVVNNPTGVGSTVVTNGTGSTVVTGTGGTVVTNPVPVVEDTVIIEGDGAGEVIVTDNVLTDNVVIIER